MKQPLPSIGGPVSDTLEADVRGWVQRKGIVIWLDLEGHYTAFVDRLIRARAEGALPYEVLGFRGSHLELMLALEGKASGVDKPHLLIHLPGFNEESVAASPHFAIYAAGTRYRKSVETLITEAAAGRVPPDEIAAFRDDGAHSVEDADLWLASHLTQSEGGIASQLAALSPTAFFDELLGGGPRAQRFAALDDGAIEGSVIEVSAIAKRLAAWFGTTSEWLDQTLPRRPGEARRPQDLAFAAASWTLSVEYVHDLAREPRASLLRPAKGLPKQVIESCRAVADHLRERHPAFYLSTANDTEGLLADEVQAARAEDLGRVDTFRFEEAKVLEAALAALGEGNWSAASQWKRERIASADRAAEGATSGPDAASVRTAGATAHKGSFWVNQDLGHRQVWDLVGAAARLGAAIDRAGMSLAPKSGSGGGLEGAIARYRDLGAAVDQAHRHLEQRRLVLLYPQLPNFETLRARLDELRLRWRAWADAWAVDFNTLCTREGFLPAPSLQQRTLFDDVVRPMSREAGTTAYFVVDAFRYEMAVELFREIDGTAGATVQLKERLAELPTVTEVGMNVLAPVNENGRLRPDFDDSKRKSGILGFSTGEYRVSEPETRRRAMQARVGGETCPWLSLSDVLGRSPTALKQAIARASLVVVHSREIDDAGEQNTGLAVFDPALQQLRAAWKLLRDAGVRRFVFTADHGFLLHDDTSGATLKRGLKADHDRRHILSYVAEDSPGAVRVPVAALGYEGSQSHLIFPETTAVFETVRKVQGFVHGGNSLQERVIPVLTVVHRSGTGGNTQRYRITAVAKEGVGGMHCLEAKVESVAQRELDFGSPKEIELALRVAGEPHGVQAELIQTRGGAARQVSSYIFARVGETFEVFFRLSGQSSGKELVELFHPTMIVDVDPGGPQSRFEVTATGKVERLPMAAEARSSGVGSSAHGSSGALSTGHGSSGTVSSGAASRHPASTGLDALPAGGVRQVFEHLQAHGMVSEEEAIRILGGARQARHFANRFHEYESMVAFSVRIETVGGVKQYIREGSSK